MPVLSTNKSRVEPTLYNTYRSGTCKCRAAGCFVRTRTRCRGLCHRQTTPNSSWRSDSVRRELLQKTPLKIQRHIPKPGTTQHCKFKHLFSTAAPRHACQFWANASGHIAGRTARRSISSFFTLPMSRGGGRGGGRGGRGGARGGRPNVPWDTTEEPDARPSELFPVSFGTYKSEKDALLT